MGIPDSGSSPKKILGVFDSAEPPIDEVKQPAKERSLTAAGQLLLVLKTILGLFLGLVVVCFMVLALSGVIKGLH
ncbi:MAG: hypothetical protein WC889_05235 [Myxococcota bacterium]